MVHLKMGNAVQWEETRAGWNYVVNLLSKLANDRGILFDGTLDQSFGYGAMYKKERDMIPYREPWIGFIHSTIELWPFLKDEYLLLDEIILSEDFTESLPYCRGIFTLSEYVARYIRTKLKDSVRVESLKHPTEFTPVVFDFEKFLKAKTIVHAGVWLRKVSSFFLVNAGTYKKILLLNPRLLGYLESELNYDDQLRIDFNQVEIMHRLPNEDYDRVLAESILFLHLCDSSASNTVIECIARGTPLLVNYLEPVAEYLGQEYPLYYKDLQEAERKLADLSLIKQTADYLKNFSGRECLRDDYFMTAFVNSGIIKSLQGQYG